MDEPSPRPLESKPDLYLDLLKKSLTASLYDESAWIRIEASRAERELKPRHLGRYARGFSRVKFVEALARQGLMLIKWQKYDPALRDNGKDWPLFGYSMIGHRRLDNLQACIQDVLANKVPGDLIETGVWRGGATILMRAVLKQANETTRTVWVADSFEGLPVPKDSADGLDLSHVEHLAVSLEQVQANFARFGLLDDNVKFLKGWFADTLPTAPVEKLAILRLDGDLYSSTMDALNALYPKVSAGGFVIVDDYGSWPACKRAVHDYIAAHNIKADIKVIDETGVYWRVTG